MALTAAHGALIKIGNGASTETFAEIANVTGGPSGAGITQNIIEARTHDSEAVHKAQTYVNYDPVTFTIAYDSSDTEHAQLRTDAAAGTLRNFQIVLTDTGAEQLAFAAYISINFSSEVDGWNEASVTLEIDGTVTPS